MNMLEQMRVVTNVNTLKNYVGPDVLVRRASVTGFLVVQMV